MKRNLFMRSMAILLCVVMLCPWLCIELPAVAATDTGGISTYLSDYGFKGKTISILGDSISTFENYSNGTAADTTNSTIRSNYVYYWNSTASSYGVSLDDTWWRQTASVLGMNVLVNNSYSGSRVHLTEFGATGAYVDRSQQLHDNTGSNSGQTPDIIVIFMGTNDMKNADDPGDISKVDYAKLKTVSSSYTATSVLEAYALMVYRAQKKYPKAEIYCSTLLPYEDISVNHVRTMKEFNSGVKEIAKNLGVYVIDLYNDSGLTAQSENFDYHMANTLHPSAYGMDCITNCVVSALLENSQYNTKKDTLHSVSYNLKDIFVKQGKTLHAVDGKALTLKLGGKSGANMNVKVTMGGVDITSSCYKSGTISIPAVTGDITVTAVTDVYNKSPEIYRWEQISNEMRSVTDGGAYYNQTSFTAGSCSGNKFSSARVGLDETAVLLHDRPWVVEWKSTGTWGSGVLIMSGADNGITAGNTYIFRRTGSSLLAVGYCDGTSYHNYGVDLSAHGISDATHIFRLVNEISDDGSNMVYLYVDGKKIAPMNNYYVGSTSQNKTVDDLNGMDLTFSTMGTQAHPLNKCTFEYIQIWEDGIPEEIETNDYRWETKNGAMTSITSDGFISNNTTIKSGSIASDGKYSGSYFQLSKAVVLLHNKPWSVEWKSKGSWLDKSEGALLLATSATTAAPYAPFLYRKSGSDMIVLGERSASAGSYQNYGISLADHGIDGDAEHVYRLINRINDDGTNMVYLFVDGVELGAMNNYFVNDKAQGTTSNWVAGKDFTFEYFGTPQFPIGNCYIEYMQIDEGCSHENIQWDDPVEPTCTEDGSKSGVCVNCGKEVLEVLPAIGHGYELTIRSATCKDYAVYEYICSKCGDSYQVNAGDYAQWSETMPEGVDPSLIESKTEYRYADCETLTSYEPSMEGYTLKSSTWEQSGTGTVNYVNSWPSGFYTSNSLYTKYNNKSKKVTASETATTKTTINSDTVVGYLYYHWCYSGSVYSVANKSGSYTTFHAYYSTTNPSNYNCDYNDMSYYTNRTATCTNSGWYFVANVYAQKYTTYNKLFTYERWSDMTEWSETEVEAADNRKIETRTLYRFKDAALLDHSYDDGVVTTQPSCSAEGVMTYTCSVCGDVHTETIPTSEHSYEGIVTAPTCTEDGFTTYTCTVCGDSYIADTVAADGHSYKSSVVGPTCTENGYYLHTCDVCGDSYIGEAIETPGHYYKPVVTAPTCTEDGYTVYTCFVCDDSYTDDFVPATGHTWISATCTEPMTCEICGETEGDVLTHSYEAVVTEPTCSDEGFTTYTCICGDSYTSDFVPVLEHEYLDGVCIYGCGTVQVLTVIFMDDMGNVLDTQFISYGDVPEAPEVYKDDTDEWLYSFTGWQDENGNFYAELPVVTVDVIYTACFESAKQCYTISWDVEGYVTTTEVPYGEIPEYYGGVPGKPDSVEYSYEFTGWDPELAPVNGDVTYYACFVAIPRSYTLAFDYNGGADMYGSTEFDIPCDFDTTVYESDVDRILTCMHPGYTLVGWNTNYDGSGEYYNLAEGFTMPAHDVTLYAIWEEICYTIRFDTDGDGTIDLEMTASEGEMLDAPEDSRADTDQWKYNFTGWMDERGDVHATLPAVTENMTYVAQYDGELMRYTVSWNVEGSVTTSEVPYGEMPVYYGDTLSKPDTDEYRYVFEGWTPELVPVTGEVTYYAVFTAVPKTYRLTFSYSGGEDSYGNLYYEILCDYGTTIYDVDVQQVLTCKYEGFTFVEWNSDVVGTGERYDLTKGFTMPAHDVILYAIWELNEYTIRFDINGDGEVDDEQTVSYGYMPTVPMAYKDSVGCISYTFLGWDKEIIAACENVTYTAMFEEIALHNYEAEVTAPTCTENGYTMNICTVCGDSYLSDEIEEALGHVFEDGVCLVCGAVDPNYETVVVPDMKLNYPSLSFEDEILYNVYFTLDDATSIVEMGMLTFTERLIDGTIEDANLVIPGYVNSGSTYMVQSKGIPAKNLSDTVYFKVYAKLADGSYVYSEVAGYNAVAYANTVLNNPSSSAKAKALVVAMLNYGAAAQEYFGYKTDALMNASLTAEQQALVQAYDESMVQPVVKADSSKVGSFVMNGGYSNIYPTVSFEGAFSINYYFTPNKSVDNGLTFYYWDAETYASVDVLTAENATGVLTMKQDGNNYGAAVEGIAAKAIDEIIYVAGIYTSNGVEYPTSVIAYSLGNYCKTIAANGEAFGAATAVYGYYAENYFAQFN